MQGFKTYLFSLVIVVVVYSCSLPGGNDPGTEYMPDMAHSIAYEANLYDYYYYNTWDGEEEYYKYAQPRKPVARTMPRGHYGIGYGDEKRAKAMQGYELNGSAPYAYADTDEERERATAEIITNPYPITDAGLARAKPLYEVNCGICHGNSGDGEGWLVSEDNKNVKYPAQPAILISDEFTNGSNGRLYHAIMHGKNVMGGYADKLSYEERWQVIHYIRSLQAKNKRLAYNEEENTLTKGALPLADWKKAYKSSDHDMMSGEAHSDEDANGHDAENNAHDHDTHDHH